VGDAGSEFKSLGNGNDTADGHDPVKFRQTYDKIPVYGSLVTVEFDTIMSWLASIRRSASLKMSTLLLQFRQLRHCRRFRSIRATASSSKDSFPHPYFYFQAQRAKWHLTFIVEDVPVVGESKAKDKMVLVLCTWIMWSKPTLVL
jgi:hypothetical protein